MLLRGHSAYSLYNKQDTINTLLTKLIKLKNYFLCPIMPRLKYESILAIKEYMLWQEISRVANCGKIIINEFANHTD